MGNVLVSAIWETAAAEMRQAGLSEKTLRNYRHTFEQLERECPDGLYDSEVGREFAQKRTSQSGDAFSLRYGRQRIRVVKIAERFVAGERPCIGSPIGGKTKAPKSQEFAVLLRRLGDYADERHLSDKTLLDYRYMASLYLVYLEGTGVTSLDDAGASTVASFLAHLAMLGSNSPKSLIVSHLRPLFVVAERADLYRATQMVGARRPHEPHPVLGNDDAEALALACVNGDVPAASAAATLLALTTGLRACDIADLEFSCIDWRRMAIMTVQRKTRNPVTVPVVPAVANALARYILDERPDTGDTHVFLGSKPPYGPFKNPSSIRDLIEIAFSAAGIEEMPVGTRVLRHSAATRMLRGGKAPLATISAVMGHASPMTTEAYLEADDERMLECVLPLPKGVES